MSSSRRYRPGPSPSPCYATGQQLTAKPYLLLYRSTQIQLIFSCRTWPTALNTKIGMVFIALHNTYNISVERQNICICLACLYLEPLLPASSDSCDTVLERTSSLPAITQNQLQDVTLQTSRSANASLYNKNVNISCHFHCRSQRFTAYHQSQL